MKQLSLFIISVLLLTSCSPSFQGGGWLIPTILGGASAWTFLRYFGIVKSPNKDMKITHAMKGNKATLLYAIVFAIATIVTTIIMASDK